MGNYRHIFAIMWALACVTLSLAQTAWTVTLNGKVLEDNKPLRRAILTLKKNGEQVQKVITAPNGKFTMILESNNEYELYFTKKGYVTKFISYSTMNVPEDRIVGLYGEFIFELELFKEMDGLNTSILDFPVFKVKYYPGLKNLDYDKKHENKIRSRLNVLLKEYKAAKEKQEARAAEAIANEEKNRLDKDYNNQIMAASVLLKSKKYEEAQDAYKKALVIKPKASFPKEKIIAIEKLIKERDKSQELSPAMEKRYAELIKTADASFANDKFASARSLYKRAGMIAPDRAYPQGQIELASEEIALHKQQSPFNNVLDDKYKLIIARADNEFMGEDYTRSRVSYLQALKVKANDLYAKGRVKEIDEIAAENYKAKAPVTMVAQKGRSKNKKGTKTKLPPAKDPEVEMGLYLLALAEKYEEGITEEIQVEGGKKVIRIIVVKDGKANEYKKEVYSWGTYYKKNNKTIPGYVFKNETGH